MQSLELAEQLIQKHFTKNPNSSISGALKLLRRQKRFDSFGDYPVLSFILRVLYEMGINISSRSVAYVIRISPDFQHLPPKDKKRVRELLFEKLYVGKNDIPDTPKTGDKTKDD